MLASATSAVTAGATVVASAALATSSVDPVLALQPGYAYAMTVQLVCQTVAFTLTFVLLVHLLFTVRLHFSFARTNLFLQLTAATILLTSLATMIAVTLRKGRRRSSTWPYMFDYIQVSIPDSDWNDAETISWYVLDTCLTLACHATHIHFLTLLFPSALEAKLIMALLLPLALVAAGLVFGDLAESDKFVTIADAIQTVCNSTLTLLYTVALLIWGLFVNRKRAWRNDGGTSGFGVLAIFLALLGTGTNYLEVKEENVQWLSHLVWTVLLWQSWLSLWWWCGAGLYAGEVEDRQAEEERKRVRDERRAARRLRRLGASTGAVLARRLTTRHRTPAAHATGHDAGASASSVSRLIQRRSQATAQAEPEAIEMQRRGTSASGGAREETVSSTSDPSTRPNAIERFIERHRPAVLRRWVGRLRQAHNEETQARADANPRQAWSLGSMLWPSTSTAQPAAPPAAPASPAAQRTSTHPTPARSPAESDTDEEEWTEPSLPGAGPPPPPHFGDVPAPSYPPPPRPSRWPTRGPREVDVF